MNHYQWLDKYFAVLLGRLGVSAPESFMGMIVADGDKCYGYKEFWEESGVPFVHGAACYLISKIAPWSETCRGTKGGIWVPVDQWVVDFYAAHQHVFVGL